MTTTTCVRGWCGSAWPALVAVATWTAVGAAFETSAGAAVIAVPNDAPTIAAALALAQPGDVIELAPGTYTEPFTLGSAQVEFRGVAGAPELVVVAPGGLDPALPLPIEIASSPDGGTVRFRDLTLAGFVRYACIGGNFSLIGVDVVASPSGRSVALSVTAGAAFLDEVEVVDLGTLPQGVPFVRVETGIAQVVDVVVHAAGRPIFSFVDAASVVNRAAISGVGLVSGAAIQANGGELSLLDSSITDVVDANGVETLGAAVTIAGCDFLRIGNPKGGFARAIAMNGPSITMTDATVVDCGSFNGPASAATFQSPAMLIKNTLFEANRPSGAGAGAVLALGVGTFQNVVFRGNSTGTNGGALRLTGAFSLEGCRFEANSAGGGDGAVTIQGGGAFYGCVFRGNRAGLTSTDPETYGGAVTVRSGQGVFVDTIFIDNSVGTKESGLGIGGAVAALAGTLAFGDSFVLDNVAYDLGGGIYLDDGPADLLLENTSICRNSPDQVNGSFTDLGGVVICGCSADLQGNGSVGGDDLALLLGAWGACGACPADIDGDGVVGPSDLAILLGGWGICGGGES